MPQQEVKSRSVFFELAKFTIVALLVITPFRFFVAQPFIVSGASMEPTFNDNEYLVIDELSYQMGDPKRGDVVIFRYPLDPAIFFVKRVIGLPGETVEIKNGAVSITKDSETFMLEEPYADPKSMKGSAPPLTLEENEYYVLGDNRSASSDSRVWGPLQKRFIIGRAYLRLYPVDEAAYLPGKVEY